MQFESTLAFGDKVVIDGDKSILGTITAFKFFWGVVPLCEVSYFNGGKQESIFIEEPRLTKIAIN